MRGGESRKGGEPKRVGGYREDCNRSRREGDTETGGGGGGGLEDEQREIEEIESRGREGGREGERRRG